MPRLLHSVQTKLTLAFVLLLGFMAGASLLLTARSAAGALLEVLRGELTAIASLAATQIDGDQLAKLRSGMESTAEFAALQAQLKEMRQAHPDIKYLYTMRRDGEQVRFVVDADYGNKQDPGASIDEVYEDVPPMLRAGFERPSADLAIVTDKWGDLLSGYAPVRNAAGQVVGLVGVDMAAAIVAEKQAFVDNMLYLVLLSGLVLAAIIVFTFSQTIIRDVRRLNQAATDISLGNMQTTIDIHRRDEIGELADSFGRMVASLKIMMLEDQDKPDDEAVDSRPPHE